jgi:repressor LexA
MLDIELLFEYTSARLTVPEEQAMAAKKKAKKLSQRQESILLFIEECIAERKHPPSIREICDHCDVSSTSVADYNLKRLEELGYIERTSKVSRGIQVSRPIGPLRETEETVHVPLYGQIAAGDPISIPEADVPPEDYIEVARNLLHSPPGRPLFALRVRGQSMIDALIDDGDIVVVAHQETAENGDMVAAWIESREEWTLKRFYRSGESVTLRPANPMLFTEQDVAEKLTFPASDVKISGRVCLVVRQV